MKYEMCDTRVAVADQVLRDVALNSSSSCVQTGYVTNPWWAVDLGVPTVVHQVTFTNARVYTSSSGTSTRV